ncbi:ATP-binding protein [Alicyclobacillus fodiniaquatilis]|jgi:PAS domain S-box-containing protein|uniref:histidine kinase n=1 Tax=Alicyclobacillus fodiniaquatilis TaxID=1661150 RepID=A0ABW4JHV8_9BACL
MTIAMLTGTMFQLSIVLIPILGYHLAAPISHFRKPRIDTLVFGFYGGIAAILDQMAPIHIFGFAENFQCVPIILSILYGKRRSGLISVPILAVYQLFSDHNGALFAIMAIVIYSALPFWMCNRYENYCIAQRIKTVLMLCVFTLVIQLGTVTGLLFAFYSTQLSHIVPPLTKLIAVAVPLQFLIMALSMIAMESVIEEQRMHRALLQSQVALQASEERYRSLVDYNPIGICAVDMENHITLANEAFAQISGYEVAELLGQSRFKLWFPEDYELATGVMDNIRHLKEVSETEFTLKHKNGNIISAQCTTVPIVVDNEVIGYYSLVKDITELRAAGELLRQSEKLSAVGQLAAGVAHEIRNPLTSLNGFLTLIDRETSGAGEYISIMQQELARIELISNELLVLGKPQAVHFQQSDLNAILHNVAALLETQANMSNVEIKTELVSAILPVWCEENQLKQVFINVVRNAIDAMPSGGTVTIASVALVGKIGVTIQDTGVGMPEDTIRRLGEPFYTTKGTGTGLGLMVSHQIIQKHDGEIHYESSPGNGTTVRVLLNCMDAVSEPALAPI